jgi:hypothetical protein
MSREEEAILQEVVNHLILSEEMVLQHVSFLMVKELRKSEVK